MAQNLCGEAYQCLFDYALSLNRDMAHFTRNYLDSFVNIKSKNRERGNSSQSLIYPKNGTSTTPFKILWLISTIFIVIIFAAIFILFSSVFGAW
jgi:hypothetical protein